MYLPQHGDQQRRARAQHRRADEQAAEGEAVEPPPARAGRPHAAQRGARRRQKERRQPQRREGVFLPDPKRIPPARRQTRARRSTPRCRCRCAGKTALPAARRFAAVFECLRAYAPLSFLRGPPPPLARKSGTSCIVRYHYTTTRAKGQLFIFSALGGRRTAAAPFLRKKMFSAPSFCCILTQKTGSMLPVFVTFLRKKFFLEGLAGGRGGAAEPADGARSTRARGACTSTRTRRRARRRSATAGVAESRPPRTVLPYNAPSKRTGRAGARRPP